MLFPAEESSYTVMIDFETKVLGTQNATLDKIEDFAMKLLLQELLVFYMN